MAEHGMAAITGVALSFLLILLLRPTHCNGNGDPPIPQSDVDLIEFPLNLEYLEAEFFLYASLGYGLDKVDPNLTMGGPPPIGARRAKLSPFVRDIILQFAYQEVGHVRYVLVLRCNDMYFFDLFLVICYSRRAIKATVKGFPRPLMDLSSESFAKVMDLAFGRPLDPPFDPYANTLNYLLASYLIPYVGLTGYVGANPNLESPRPKKVFSYIQI